MIVVSSAELRNNLKKYLDTATNETVVIQRGRTETFVLHRQESLPEITTEVPADFHRAITGKEVVKAVEDGLRDIIRRKQELNITV